MMTLRGIFQIFVLTLVFAVGSNGVVMASSDVVNQDHCLHAAAKADYVSHVHDSYAASHESSDNALQEHDHETCMMHAFSAVAYEAHGAAEMQPALSAVLSAIEHEFLALERSDNLLRPPNT